MINPTNILNALRDGKEDEVVSELSKFMGEHAVNALKKSMPVMKKIMLAVEGSHDVTDAQLVNACATLSDEEAACLTNMEPYLKEFQDYTSKQQKVSKQHKERLLVEIAALETHPNIDSETKEKLEALKYELSLLHL